MLHLCHVLEFIVDGLYYGSFSEQHLVGDAHKRVLHLVFFISLPKEAGSISKATMQYLGQKLTKNRILCPSSLLIFTKHDRLFFDGILSSTIVVTVVYFGYYNILFRAKTIKN